jgi:hypothetical protein
MPTLPHAESLLHPEPTPLDAVRAFRALAAPFRFRVIRDVEGWPVIPGKLGRLEWHDGRELAVYTARPRLFAKLWTIPGVRRWQTGDQEVRGLFPVAALPAVTTLSRARRRRTGHPAGLRNLRPQPRHSAASAA